MSERPQLQSDVFASQVPTNCEVPPISILQRLRVEQPKLDPIHAAITTLTTKSEISQFMHEYAGRLTDTFDDGSDFDAYGMAREEVAHRIALQKSRAESAGDIDQFMAVNTILFRWTPVLGEVNGEIFDQPHPRPTHFDE